MGVKHVALAPLLVSIACAAPVSERPRARPLLPLTQPQLVSMDAPPCTGDHCPFWNRVRQSVHEHWNPIHELRRRDPAGLIFGKAARTTVLRVTIDEAGNIATIAVKASSGLDFLDEEAIRAFHAAAPLGDPPRGALGADGHMTFDYALTCGFEQRSDEPRLAHVWTNGESEQKEVEREVDGYLKRFYQRMMTVIAADPKIRDVKEPPHELMQVRFTLRIDGAVVDATLLRSSGSPLFDELVMKALRGAGSNDPPPDVLFDANGHFVGLLSYRNEPKQPDLAFEESGESFLSRVERRIGTRWPPAGIVRAYRPTPSSRRHFVIAHIVLDPTGELRGTWLTASSGVDAIDGTALDVIREAAPFENPPASLVGADGLIQFETELFL